MQEESEAKVGPTSGEQLAVAAAPPTADAPAPPPTSAEPEAPAEVRLNKRQQKNEEYWARQQAKKEEQAAKWREKKARRQDQLKRAFDGTDQGAAAKGLEPVAPPARWGYTLALDAPLRVSHRYAVPQPPPPRRPLSHGCFAKSCKWAPDGSALLTNSEDNILRVYQLPEELRSSGEGGGAGAAAGGGGVSAAKVVSPSEDTVAAWEPSLTMSEGECVYDYAWYPRMSERSNCCFVTSSREHPIHLWDALSGELRATYRGISESTGEPVSPHSLCFSPDGGALLAGYHSEVRVFDPERGGFHTDSRPTRYKIGKKKSGVSGIISCVAFNKRMDSVFAAASFSAGCVVGDLRVQGRSVSLIKGAHKGGITHTMFSHCGRYLYTAARRDGLIKVWDMRLTSQRWDGKYVEAAALETPAMRRDVGTNQRITFDLDHSGRRLYSGCRSGNVKVFSVPFGELEAEVKMSDTCVNCVAVHPTLPVVAATTGERKFAVQAKKGRIVTMMPVQSYGPTADSDSDSDSSSTTSSSAPPSAAAAEAAPAAAAPAPASPLPPSAPAAAAAGAACSGGAAGEEEEEEEGKGGCDMDVDADAESVVSSVSSVSSVSDSVFDDVCNAPPCPALDAHPHPSHPTQDASGGGGGDEAATNPITSTVQLVAGSLLYRELPLTADELAAHAAADEAAAAAATAAAAAADAKAAAASEEAAEGACPAAKRARLAGEGEEEAPAPSAAATEAAAVEAVPVPAAADAPAAPPAAAETQGSSLPPSSDTVP